MIRSSKYSLVLWALAVAMSLCFANPGIAGKLNASAMEYGQTYDQFIVRFKKNAPERSNAAVRQQLLDAAGPRNGVRIVQLRRLAVGADVIKTNRKLDRVAAQQLMQRLANNPNVEYVELDAIQRPTFTPNDPMYSSQWNLFEPAAGINLPAAWDQTGGSGVIVAVLDTGFTKHDDLFMNLTNYNYDFISDPAMSVDGDGRDDQAIDPGDWTNAGDCGDGKPATNSSWHGTHVAGTVAAMTNNGLGVAGVAFVAKVLPLRVIGKCGGRTSDIADAIVWASGGTVAGVFANGNPAEVINMSLGSLGTCGATYQEAINFAVAAGVVVVVAAGNKNSDASGFSPASCANVITVAAVARTGARASYSNFGSKVDVAAPGGDGVDSVLSTTNKGTKLSIFYGEDYGGKQGTSMAAPHVAGTVALMQSLSVNPPAIVEAILKSTARPLPVACTLGCGAGIIDASAAVTAAKNARFSPKLFVDDFAVTEGNSGTKLATFTVKLSAPTGQAVTFNVATANGTATAGSDYVASTLTGQSIAAGLTSKTFTVTINGDTTVEANETFLVNVTNVVGVAVLDGQAEGTIFDDDSALSIADVAITEGNSSTKLATFTVKLSRAAATAVTYNIATANSTAAAGSDYVASTLTGQSIAAGLTSKTFTVTINGDTTVEANETFLVNLSSAVGATVFDGQALATILNDDGPTLSIADVSIAEGNSGTKVATFTVKLSVAAAVPVTYTIATANATAVAGSDYVAASLTGQSLPAGTTSKTFAVTINGDGVIEADETFKVFLSSAIGASIFDAVAVGTILNDD